MSDVKTNKNFDEIIRPTLVLTVIALVTALLLALTNAGTADIIAKNAAAALLKSRQEILPEAASFSEDKSGTLDGETFTYVEGLDGSGKVVGYIFQNSSPGYGGPVTALVAINLEGKIAGLKAMDLNETPGLGMKVAEPAFCKQYIGRSGEIKVSKSEASDTAILAVTGATISSRAFTKSVNKALKEFTLVKGGGATASAPAAAATPEEKAYPGAKLFSDEKKGAKADYKEVLSDRGAVIGYLFKTVSKGYIDNITVLTGISKSGKIVGTSALELRETEGLGADVAEDSFENQFVGSKGPFTLDGGVEAVSGATASSLAYVDAVNLAIAQFHVLTGGAS